MEINDVAGHIRNADKVRFIIGAGASKSANIPLSSELVDQIKRDFVHCLGSVPKHRRDDYGLLMQALTPTERKRLLLPYLNKSRINWGHIALVRMIQHCESIDRVLSFNFDLILERAAALLGFHIPVYDFAVSPTSELNLLVSPAIFHLHGQSYGLRMLNSDTETQSHAEPLRPILRDSVRDHVTIVIGYSGTTDAALKIITEEFRSDCHLLWFGHSATPSENLKPLLAKDKTHYVGGRDFDKTMVELAELLNCWPPDVITNPPAHVLQELSEVTRYPTTLKDEPIDLLTSTRRRLKEAEDRWDEETQKDPAYRAELAVITSTEQESTDESVEDMTPSERNARAHSAYRAGRDLYDDNPSLEHLNQALAKFKECVKFAEKDSFIQLSGRHSIARCLHDMGRPQEALVLFEALLLDDERVKGKDDPGTLVTRYAIASCLQHMGRPQEALVLFEALLLDDERVKGKDDPDTLVTRHAIARCLQGMGRPQEALVLFEALLLDDERVKGKDDPGTLVTRYAIASCLQHMGRRQQALMLFEALLLDYERVRGEDDPGTLVTRHAIARCLQYMSKTKDALLLFEDVVKDYEQYLGQDHLHTFAVKIFYWSCLGELGNTTEVIKGLTELLPRVERAEGSRFPGYTLLARLTLAKSHLELGERAIASDYAKGILEDLQSRGIGGKEPLYKLAVEVNDSLNKKE